VCQPVEYQQRVDEELKKPSNSNDVSAYGCREDGNVIKLDPKNDLGKKLLARSASSSLQLRFSAAASGKKEKTAALRQVAKHFEELRKQVHEDLYCNWFILKIPHYENIELRDLPGIGDKDWRLRRNVCHSLPGGDL